MIEHLKGIFLSDVNRHYPLTISPEGAMSMREFIKQNRTEIDKAIRRVWENCRLDDGERRAWIENDEGLYNWARSEGVKV